MPEITTKLKAERIQQTLEENSLQEKLKAERIQERLDALPGWNLVHDGTALRRRVELPTLRAAALFANLAAEIGAAAGTHPTVLLHGRSVTLTITARSGEGTDLHSDPAFDPTQGPALTPARTPARTPTQAPTESTAGGLTDLDFDLAELLSLPAASG